MAHWNRLPREVESPSVETAWTPTFMTSCRDPSLAEEQGLIS